MAVSERNFFVEGGGVVGLVKKRRTGFLFNRASQGIGASIRVAMAYASCDFAVTSTAVGKPRTMEAAVGREVAPKI